MVLHIIVDVQVMQNPLFESLLNCSKYFLKAFDLILEMTDFKPFFGCNIGIDYSQDWIFMLFLGHVFRYYLVEDWHSIKMPQISSGYTSSISDCTMQLMERVSFFRSPGIFMISRYELTTLQIDDYGMPST